MELKDLLGIPLEELTEDQLEEKFRQLKKLKISTSKVAKTVTRKSNKDRRIEDLLSQLSIEDIEELKKKL